jgi:hypothetical protein
MKNQETLTKVTKTLLGTYNVLDPDPGSCGFFTPGSEIQDGEKIRIRDEHPR